MVFVPVVIVRFFFRISHIIVLSNINSTKIFLKQKGLAMNVLTALASIASVVSSVCSSVLFIAFCKYWRHGYCSAQIPFFSLSHRFIMICDKYRRSRAITLYKEFISPGPKRTSVRSYDDAQCRPHEHDPPSRPSWLTWSLSWATQLFSSWRDGTCLLALPSKFPAGFPTDAKECVSLMHTLQIWHVCHKYLDECRRTLCYAHARCNAGPYSPAHQELP